MSTGPPGPNGLFGVSREWWMAVLEVSFDMDGFGQFADLVWPQAPA